MTPEEEMDRWESIDKYISGKMTEKEKINFQQQMEKDKDWQQDVEAAQKMHAVMDAYFIEQRMRDTLQQLQTHEQKTAINQDKPAKHYRMRSLYIGIAAAACLIIYFTLAPVALPDAGYDVTVLRSADSSVFSSQQQMAFDQFFEGQSYMAEGQYVQAANSFEQVLQNQDIRPYFKEAAQWHLAVSYLKSNQPRKAGKLYASLNNCDTCEYHVSWLNHLKMKWQITWQQWLY